MHKYGNAFLLKNQQLRKFFFVLDEKELKALPAIAIDLFSILVWFTERSSLVQPSQAFLAAKLSITREHCNRLLKRLKDIGLINSTYRHLRTCIYTIAPVVLRGGILHHLTPYIKSLKSFAISRLLSYFPGKITHINKEGLLGIKDYINTPSDKGWSMKQEEHPVPVWVRSIECLPLSRWGQIQLSGFPSDAIQEATYYFKFAKNIRDPFSWFFDYCREYCKRENKTIDYAYVELLKKKFGYKKGKPFLLDTKKSYSSRRSTAHFKKHTSFSSLPLLTAAAYKPYAAPTLVTVNKEKELKEREQAKQTPGWKWMESFLGKSFDPPIPSHLPTKGL